MSIPQLDVFREPPKLLALLELGPSLPNAPPRRVTSKVRPGLNADRSLHIQCLISIWLIH